MVEAAVLKFKRENRQLRNEASFVPTGDGLRSRTLSRVEMNALRAPLTAPANDDCVLDETDDFIDTRCRFPANYFTEPDARLLPIAGEIQ